MTTLYGVVDIGGTKTLIGIATENKIIETRYLKTSDIKSPEMLIDILVEEFDLLIALSNYKDGILKSVGISIPGPLNREEGIIHFTGNLNWSNFRIVEYLQKKMNQIPIIIDDDANAAGIGEAVYGAGRGYKNQIYVTISTGIGGAIIIDRQIYRGSRDLAGELGHITVVPDGPPCSCGNFGCLEALASGTAITKRGQQLLIQEQSVILSKLTGKKTLTAEMIFEAVRQGDKACYSIIEQVCRYLGIGLANLVQIFNPEAIILGGGIMNQSSLLIPKIETEMKLRLFKVQQGRVNIEIASLNGQSGLWGALHLAKNHNTAIEVEQTCRI
ncbi:ROK family protein [Heyndrickxia sp. NPDC080065]|uniref:ROK family protein n=1 Tax=Heyndrickxia sp. NPDC080065 TaxID=3390568 RepID=UPI003CFDDF08